MDIICWFILLNLVFLVTYVFVHSRRAICSLLTFINSFLYRFSWKGDITLEYISAQKPYKNHNCLCRFYSQGQHLSAAVVWILISMLWAASIIELQEQVERWCSTIIDSAILINCWGQCECRGVQWVCLTYHSRICRGFYFIADENHKSLVWGRLSQRAARRNKTFSLSCKCTTSYKPVVCLLAAE